MNKLPFEKIEREILVRQEAKTDPKLGVDPDKRPVAELINYGVVNIDKPKGPTSHQVSDFVQKILGINKAGHSGTLDPAVTGVLAVALGRATRVVEYLLHAGKEYVAVMHLHKEVSEEKIKSVFKKFTGKIKQKPPLKSAVKRVVREREIYYVDILEINKKDVLFKVGCEAGTYIRKLCIHSETEIFSKRGFVTASDFYSNPFIIYSLDNNKMIEKNPSAVQKLHSPNKLVKITMSSGISLIVTPDHELLTSKKEGYRMQEAQELRVGDYLVKSLNLPEISNEIVIADLLDDSYLIPQDEIKSKCKLAFISKYGSIRAMYRKLGLDRKAFLKNSDYAITIRHLKLAGIYEQVKRKIHIFKTQKGAVVKMKSLNEDFFYLLGLIASDGNNTRERKTVRFTRIKFHNKNEVLINKFLTVYQTLFPNIPISKKKLELDLFQLDTSNSFLATIASSLGVKSPQKYSDLLPILNSPSHLIKSFLKGYFDGDGSAYYKNKIRVKGQHSTIRLHTSSLVDANRLHKMLLNVNIPNKIFKRKKFSSGSLKRIRRSRETPYTMYDVTIETSAAKKRFIKEVGSNHPFKLSKFKQILSIKDDSDIYDSYYIGMHWKEEVRKNKSKLYKMGGTLSRVLNGQMPITRGFYKKASQLVKLPSMGQFIIEEIKSVEKIDGKGYVYDMTVPDTHNFLIETGFVSSNCHDIGKKLGTGAHMAELRRTKAGCFDETTLVTLQDLADAYWYYKNKKNEKFIRKAIQPMENAVSHLAKVWVLDTTVESLCHGIDLKVPGIAKVESKIKADDKIAIMTLKNELIALGTAKINSAEMVKDKGLAVRTEKVFMGSGGYKIK